MTTAFWDRVVDSITRMIAHPPFAIHHTDRYLPRDRRSNAPVDSEPLSESAPVKYVVAMRGAVITFYEFSRMAGARVHQLAQPPLEFRTMILNQRRGLMTSTNLYELLGSLLFPVRCRHSVFYRRHEHLSGKSA